MFDASDLERAAEAIQQAETLVLACHVGPDGDALGSMLGMAYAAANAGKTVIASFGEPFVVGDTYRFLPVEMLVPPSAVPTAPALMVSFDAGSIDRLADLRMPAENAETLVVIDHHASNAGFGTVDLVDPEAAATAEIVLDLLDQLGWVLDSVTAECLLTGVVTDTGRFQYSNTSPRTLRIAARLVEAGARPEVIGRHVYEESPFGFLKVSGAVLSRAVLEPELHLVWSVLTPDDLEGAGIGLDDTDPLIDLLRLARESEVAVLAKALDTTRTKLSMRSRGGVDVGAIASALGGGGHHNAAGVTVEASVDVVMARVRSLLAADG